MRLNKDYLDGDEIYVIQAKTIEEIKNIIVEDMSDSHIKKKDGGYEVVVQLDDIRMDYDFGSRVMIEAIDSTFNENMIDHYCRILSLLITDFHILWDVDKQKNLLTLNVGDTLRKMFIKEYIKHFNEELPDNFLSSTLFESMMIEIVFEYLNEYYKDEKDFMENSLMPRYIKFTGDYVIKKRLNQYYELTIKQMTLIYPEIKDLRLI